MAGPARYSAGNGLLFGWRNWLRAVIAGGAWFALIGLFVSDVFHPWTQVFLVSLFVGSIATTLVAIARVRTYIAATHRLGGAVLLRLGSGFRSRFGREIRLGLPALLGAIWISISAGAVARGIFDQTGAPASFGVAEWIAVVIISLLFGLLPGFVAGHLYVILIRANLHENGIILRRASSTIFRMPNCFVPWNDVRDASWNGHVVRFVTRNSIFGMEVPQDQHDAVAAVIRRKCRSVSTEPSEFPRDLAAKKPKPPNFFSTLSIVQFSLGSYLRTAILLCLLMGILFPVTRIFADRWHESFWIAFLSGWVFVGICFAETRRRHAATAMQFGGRLLARVSLRSEDSDLPRWCREVGFFLPRTIVFFLLAILSIGCAYQISRDASLSPWVSILGMLLPGIVFGVISGSYSVKNITGELLERGALQYVFPDDTAHVEYKFIPWEQVRSCQWNENHLELIAESDLLKMFVPSQMKTRVTAIVDANVRLTQESFVHGSSISPSGSLPALLPPPDDFAHADPSRAVDEYTRRIEREPDRAIWYFHRARAYRRINQLDDALADLTTAIDLAPQDAAERRELWSVLGGGKFVGCLTFCWIGRAHFWWLGWFLFLFLRVTTRTFGTAAGLAIDAARTEVLRNAT